MDKMERVDILLSTYNGELYIDELLCSLINQTYSAIRVIIRDDGSTDRTVERLKYWKCKYPDKIIICQDDKGNLGVTKSMFILLSKSDSKYAMFCDQDDVWFAKKVAYLVKAIMMKEAQYKNIPLIVHCDSYVTDAQLQLISKEKEKARHQYQIGRKKQQASFANLLLSNVVQGASMMINNLLKDQLTALLDASLDKKVMYDSLIASVCAIKGKIFYLNKPLMYYRQHGKNVVGVTVTSISNLWGGGEKEVAAIRYAHFLSVEKRKCKIISRVYGKELNEYQKSIIEHYLKRPNDWLEFIKLRLYRDFSITQIIVMILFGIDN